MEHQPRLTDAERIAIGIIEACELDQPIDEETAMGIAAQLHGGQFTALYSLASTGTVDPERLRRELAEDREAIEATENVPGWYEAMEGYIQAYEAGL